MTAIFGAVAEAIVKGIISWLQGWLDKRALVQQGVMEQHTADVEASNKEGRDDAKIDAAVRGESDADLNAELRSVQHPSDAHGG